MAKKTNFFLGANSAGGFQNLFPELMDPEDTCDLMILKGGPGVGKNTFMREIARTMEETGMDVEYLWCSGDPDSLDGVVFPQIRCGVVLTLKQVDIGVIHTDIFDILGNIHHLCFLLYRKDTTFYLFSNNSYHNKD